MSPNRRRVVFEDTSKYGLGVEPPQVTDDEFLLEHEKWLLCTSPLVLSSEPSDETSETPRRITPSLSRFKPHPVLKSEQPVSNSEVSRLKSLLKEYLPHVTKLELEDLLRSSYEKSREEGPERKAADQWASSAKIDHAIRPGKLLLIRVNKIYWIMTPGREVLPVNPFVLPAGLVAKWSPYEDHERCKSVRLGLRCSDKRESESNYCKYHKQRLRNRTLKEVKKQHIAEKLSQNKPVQELPVQRLTELLPNHLGELVSEARNDEELLSLMTQLQINDARQSETLLQIRELYRAAEEEHFREEGDVPFDPTNTHYIDSNALTFLWNQFDGLNAQKKDLVAAEIKKEQVMSHSIPAKSAQALILLFVYAVMDTVKDDAQLKQISDKFTGLLHRAGITAIGKPRDISNQYVRELGIAGRPVDPD